MPWKPPSINERARYGADWRRQRAAVLRSDPLCRFCLAAGRTVAATVVDHIRPLEDGGTNEQSNLQPLCKRCHDSIKTPHDASARRAAQRADVAIRVLPLASRIAYGFDCRSIRRLMAGEHGFDKAHSMSLASAEGLIRAASDGQLGAIVVRILCDDVRFARLMRERYGCAVDVERIGSVPSGGPEEEWLARRFGSEYTSRHGDQSEGTQEQRVG